MRVRIKADRPAKLEIDGISYAIAPRWYSTDSCTEGVVGAIHKITKFGVEYYQLSMAFEKQSDLHAALEHGFEVIAQKRAYDVVHELLKVGDAEEVPPL